MRPESGECVSAGVIDKLLCCIASPCIDGVALVAVMHHEATARGPMRGVSVRA